MNRSGMELLELCKIALKDTGKHTGLISAIAIYQETHNFVPQESDGLQAEIEELGTNVGKLQAFVEEMKLKLKGGK